jgi:hypothetical protein
LLTGDPSEMSCMISYLYLLILVSLHTGWASFFMENLSCLLISATFQILFWYQYFLL